MKQIWHPIPGWEGLYEITRAGTIRSLPRKYALGRVLRRTAFKNGYLYVTLTRNNRPVKRTVHSLVMETFMGPCPPGLEVRHLDGDKANCRLDNLRYGTRSVNALDKRDHGTDHQANKTHCSKGHEYTEENTIWWGPHGRWRRCRSCHRRISLAYTIKRRDL
jgi:hypothetical protein